MYFVEEKQKHFTFVGVGVGVGYVAVVLLHVRKLHVVILQCFLTINTVNEIVVTNAVLMIYRNPYLTYSPHLILADCVIIFYPKGNIENRQECGNFPGNG